jgi:BirA family biotin operon repressor/biotin-[acetyl-CoA-carboxylase] ligase
MLAILNDGQFHSGTELGESLKITRAAIWKLIKQLEDYGIAIESVHGKGYRLAQALFLLDKQSILQQSKLKKTAVEISILGSINSTQDYLKALKSDRPQISLAEHQSSGRGRLGRHWHSPFGMNLLLSYKACIKKDISELGGLSLAVSIAVIKALENYGFKIPLKIKWPNDIYCQDKKLAGILIEVSGESHGSAQVIIGLGLNINMSHAGINSDWTSLYLLTQKPHDRSEIAGHVIAQLFECLKQFEQEGLQPFLALYERYDYLRDRQIVLQSIDQEHTGTAIGINELGHLLLNNNGKASAYAVGDATIKSLS